MILIKDTRSFDTDDPDLIRAFLQNDWKQKKEETPLVVEEKKPSTRKKSTK